MSHCIGRTVPPYSVFFNRQGCYSVATQQMEVMFIIIWYALLLWGTANAHHVHAKHTLTYGRNHVLRMYCLAACCLWARRRQPYGALLCIGRWKIACRKERRAAQMIVDRRPCCIISCTKSCSLYRWQGQLAS